MLQEARLIILGDGGLRSEMIKQAIVRGVSEHVALPGFQSNPLAWMSKAAVFALSSRWEGSPNTLTGHGARHSRGHHRLHERPTGTPRRRSRRTASGSGQR